MANVLSITGKLSSMYSSKSLKCNGKSQTKRSRNDMTSLNMKN